MSLSTLAGYGFILLGGGGLAAIFLRTRQLPPVARGFSEPSPAPVAKPTDRLDRHVERKKALQVIERDQTIRLLGETEERAVRGTIDLSEMTETNGRWHKTGNAYRALQVAGGIWIFKVPRREGGEPIWVKAAMSDTPYQLADFFIGSKEKQGPARLFKLNGQTTPVPFVLPNVFGDTTGYEVTDIGRFATTVDGKEDIFRSGDQYPFVTAHALDGSRILIYLDARKDMARGTGGLFIGEVFEPDVDIASLL